jgi:hypothetical protein
MPPLVPLAVTANVPLDVTGEPVTLKIPGIVRPTLETPPPPPPVALITPAPLIVMVEPSGLTAPSAPVVAIGSCAGFSQT